MSRNTRTDFRSFSRCIAISARCEASSSRSTLADTLTSPIVNGLHVRVKAEWREDEQVLDDIGLK